MRKLVPIFLVLAGGFTALLTSPHYTGGQGTTTVVGGAGGLPSGFSASGNGNQILAPNGTVAAPSYSFSGETGTGLSAGPTALGFGVNGTNILTMTVAAAQTSVTFAAPTYQTNTNCSSSASPAACAGSAAGSVVIAAAATTVQVNTSAVTANSQIFFVEDDSLGTRLSVTCNTTSLGATKISARTAGTSFTITTATAPTTNPACLSYWIVN